MLDQTTADLRTYRFVPRKVQIGDISLSILSVEPVVITDHNSISPQSLLRIKGGKEEEVEGVKGIPIFPTVVKLVRVGIPSSINGESVALEWADVNFPFISWEGNLPDEIPFVLLESESGLRIISKADIKEDKAVQEREKPKKRRTIHAKRSTKKRRLKGKSARKGRRV